MGFQVRKRTKGKDGWWNGSYSKKGVGASGSVKISSNVTYNTGDLINGKTGSRLTVNLGNGVRYVSYGKKRSTRKPKQVATQEQRGFLVTTIALLRFFMAVGVALIGFLIFVSMIVFAFGG